MPISAFSCEQDYEVKAYRAMRAQYLQREALRKCEARLASNLPPKKTLGERLFGSRQAVSVRGRTVKARRLEEDSDYESDDEVVHMREVLQQKK